MVKPISIFLCVALSLSATAQREYFIVDLERQDNHITGLITQYKSTSRQKRYAQIDSIAQLRTSYFLSVLMETSKFSSLDKSIKLIPTGKLAHRRFFGSPDFFKEGSNSVYSENLIFLPEIEKKLKAEIMQQVFFSILTPKKLNPAEVVDRAINFYNKTEGSDFMLKAYKNSPGHHKAIISFGGNLLGTDTKALVSQTWDGERNKWKYEAIIYNIVLFSE